MNTQALFPFIFSIVRHAIVAYGVVEVSKADETSTQIAGAACTIVGLAWSFYNAHQLKKAKAQNDSAQ